MSDELISYAMDFVSYLFSKIKGINKVILYGSIARNDYDEKSDVDLFIDINDKKIEGKINNILESYYKTKKFKEWTLKGIKNNLSIFSGELDDEEWKDLKRSIINTGIILYGKYKAEVEKINHYTLFSFENIKPNKKRVGVFRKLFGFNLGNKKYHGIINRMNGKRVGKGNVIVPIEHANELKRYFKEQRINFMVYDFWTDDKI